MPGLTFRLMWPPAALETVQTSGEGLLSRKGKEEKNKGLIQWASSSLPGNQCVTRQWFIGCVCSRWNSWKQKREREGEERARERWVRLSASKPQSVCHVHTCSSVPTGSKAEAVPARDQYPFLSAQGGSQGVLCMKGEMLRLYQVENAMGALLPSNLDHWTLYCALNPFPVCGRSRVTDLGCLLNKSSAPIWLLMGWSDYPVTARACLNKFCFNIMHIQPCT